MQFEYVVLIGGCAAIGVILITAIKAQKCEPEELSRVESRYYEEKVAARQRSDDYLAEHKYQQIQQSQRKEIIVNVDSVIPKS